MTPCACSAFLRARRASKGGNAPCLRCGLVLLVVGLLAYTTARADDPPVRLQRKPQPDPVPEKLPVMPREEEQPAAPSEGMRLQQSMEEALARLTRNLEQTDERLKRPDIGEGTRQIQTEVVRGFDALIEQVKQQQQQQQNSSASSKSSKPRSRSDRDQKTAKKQAGQEPGERPGQESQQQQANTGQGGGGRSPEEQRKLADLYKDVWGHLPETLRQQMDAYGREQFMAKYNELLKQYYATLAEKGRQKGD